ncbi:DUF2214 family protein [Silvimonas iriomotensis]|nr:DUF2214 family protein [Silvimonas iriomotensis]
MVSSWVLAVIHLLGVGLAFAAIYSRARFLGKPVKQLDLPEAFLADSLWGISALVLVLTGLTRAFGGFEKGTLYYGHQPFFHIKMACLVLIFLLEIFPMITLLRWRIGRAKGDVTLNLAVAAKLSQISYVQLFLLVPMVLCAAAMARGIMI